MVSDDPSADLPPEEDAPETDDGDASAEGDRSLKARFAEVRERLERTSEQLRARERAGELRDRIREYPVLSVLGAATLGALVAQGLSRGSSGEQRSERTAEDLPPRSESVAPSAPANGREDTRTRDGDGSARGSADRGGPSNRARRVGRELGDLVKESAQAALLTVLTRKLNDWLGPEERVDTSA